MVSGGVTVVRLLLVLLLLVVGLPRSGGAATEAELAARIAHAHGAELHALLRQWLIVRKQVAPGGGAVAPSRSAGKSAVIDLGGDDDFAAFGDDTTTTATATAVPPSPGGRPTTLATGSSGAEEQEFAAFAATPAPAASAGVGGERSFDLFGRFESKVAVDTHRENRFEDVIDWRNELRLGVDARFDEATSLRLSMQAIYQFRSGFDNQYDWETNLFEAYLDRRQGAWSWRVGKQIVSWGRADAINPTDNINPQDFREIVTIGHDDRKIPITMVRGRRPFAGGNLDALYIPFFVPNKFDIVGADYAVLGPGWLPPEWERLFIKLGENFHRRRITFGDRSPFRVDKPERKLTNGDVGARWSSHWRRFDYSLSFLSTHSDFPVISLDPTVLTRFDLNNSDTRGFLENAEVSDLLRLRRIFSMRFPRQSIYGADFETVLGPYSIRGEAALTFDQPYYRANFSPVGKPQLSYVLGGDRLLPFDIYTNIQLLQTVILRYDSDILSRRVRTGMTGTLRRNFFDERLHLQANTLYFFRDNDYFLNLQVAYDLDDDVNVALGINLFQGDRDASLAETGSLSRFNNNDHFYTRLLYHF